MRIYFWFLGWMVSPPLTDGSRPSLVLRTAAEAGRGDARWKFPFVSCIFESSCLDLALSEPEVSLLSFLPTFHFAGDLHLLISTQVLSTLQWRPSLVPRTATGAREEGWMGILLGIGLGGWDGLRSALSEPEVSPPRRRPPPPHTN